MILVNRDQLPGIAVDTVVVRIHHNVKPADLIGSHGGLHNRNTGYYLCLFQQRVAVTANNDVYTPVRIQQCSQFLICLKTNVG